MDRSIRIRVSGDLVEVRRRGIDTLYPRSLEHIYVGYDNAHVTVVFLDRAIEWHASYLSNMDNLASLTLIGNPMLTDIYNAQELEYLPRTRQLSLSNITMDNFPVDSRELRDLSLTDMIIPPLEFPVNISLERLIMNSCGIRSIETMVNLRQLRRLSVPNNYIRDIRPLAGRELISLDLHGNEIEDVNPLGTCDYLYSLNIADNPIICYRRLANAPSLRLLIIDEEIREMLPDIEDDLPNVEIVTDTDDYIRCGM